MRTTESEWNAIRARIPFGADLPPVQDIPNLDVFLRNSRMAFETSKNPIVYGLTRWIIHDLHASLDDVVAWYIEDTINDGPGYKAFRVILRDDGRYIGLVSSRYGNIWRVDLWKRE